MAFRTIRKTAAKLFRAKTVSEENKLLLAKASRAGERIAFVNSFPRSGNTWVRHILSDCFLQMSGQITATELPVHPDKIIPDRYVNRISERDLSVAAHGIFVKTHDRFDVAAKLLDQATDRRLRHLYIFRRPEDSLVSYYHFHRRYEHLHQHAQHGVDAFVLEHLDSWIEHVASYLEGNEQHPGTVFFLSYERLLSNPIDCLVPAFKFLDIEIEASVLETAVANMAFDNLRASEEKNPLNPKEFFFRKGTSGGGQQELKSSTLETISSKASEVLEKGSQASLDQCCL